MNKTRGPNSVKGAPPPSTAGEMIKIHFTPHKQRKSKEERGRVDPGIKYKPIL